MENGSRGRPPDNVSSVTPESCSEQPPWSKNALRQLGERVRDGSDGADHVPTYDEVLFWYGDLAATIQWQIRSIDWTAVLGENPLIEVTSRAKTIDTLREKLRRDTATPLSNVQDIAGVRIEAKMNLTQQDDVALAIVTQFDHTESAVRDIRGRPHSGYRAVHLWLRLPAGRVEVQIRTHLQGSWANMYEAIADRFGRGLRYGEMSSDPEISAVVRNAQELSRAGVARLEAELDRIYHRELKLKNSERLLAELHLHDAPRAQMAWEGLERSQALLAEERATYERDAAMYSEGFRDLELQVRGSPRRDD